MPSKNAAWVHLDCTWANPYLDQRQYTLDLVVSSGISQIFNDLLSLVRAYKLKLAITLEVVHVQFSSMKFLDMQSKFLRSGEPSNTTTVVSRSSFRCESQANFICVGVSVLFTTNPIVVLFSTCRLFP